MATLNLKEKKIASAENLRLLSSLILSLSSKQGAIENKLINNWVASTAYIKDESFVIYDELLYVCKISNADDTFDKNKWTCLSPTISELTKSDIEALVNLTPEEISKLSDLISTEIRLDKTFSSSDTYTRIQAAIDTAKEYTNNQLGKAVKPAYKVVASTSEVTETGYFYLISNGTNYDMYVLSSDGAVVSLGTSDVDLSDYYTKSEVDTDFLKTSDADRKFATITTVDGKFDKTNILTALDNSATDDQVYSAKAINAELDGVVKKTDISTTINSTSTDDTVPTNKAVETRISKREIIKNVDLNTFVDEGKYYIASGCTNSPIDGGYLNIMRYDDDFVCQICARYYISTSKNMYIRTKVSGTWQEWQSVCTTSVADVPVTDVTFASPNVSKARENEVCKYCVKNGVCYVTLNDLLFSSGYKSEESFVVLPKPAMRQDFELTDSLGTTVLGKLFLEESGAMHLYTNTTPVTATGYISFSYPVAEN